MERVPASHEVGGLERSFAGDGFARAFSKTRRRLMRRLSETTIISAFSFSAPSPSVVGNCLKFSSSFFQFFALFLTANAGKAGNREGKQDIVAGWTMKNFDKQTLDERLKPESIQGKFHLGRVTCETTYIWAQAFAS